MRCSIAHAPFRAFAGVAFLAAGLFAPAPAPAQDATYLQMANMTAVAKTPDGRRANMPVTAFLQVEDTAAASTICRRVPVVRNAVLDATTQQPIPYSKGNLESSSVSALVAQRINAALGAKIVARVAFVHGTPKEAPESATDLADAGDMTRSERSAKTGRTGQMAPCRRIVAPPKSLNWVNADAKKPSQSLAPPTPPLRENRAPIAPVPEFKSHPQFAPPASSGGSKPRSQGPPPTRPPIAVVGKTDPIAATMPPSARDCVPLDTFWTSARYPYAGVLYILTRVFTIDADGDGRTDNVGFVLAAEGQPDVIFRYFDEPGRAAIDLFPSLAIKNPEIISRACFASFAPDVAQAASPHVKNPLSIDILESTSSPPATEPMQATGAGFWLFFLAAAIGLMSALTLFARRRRRLAPVSTAETDDARGSDLSRERRGGADRRKIKTPVPVERRGAPDRRRPGDGRRK